MSKEFHWTYVCMKHQEERTGEVWYAIHELYSHGFVKKGKKSWTDTPIEPIGESVGELRKVLKMMLKDTYRNPTFDYKTGKIVKEKRKRL